MKKHATRKILLTALAVLLVALCATVVIVAVESQSNTDYGEKLISYQVSMNGRMNLKFIYSDLGNADGYIAEVYKPDGSLKTSYTYKRADIEENKTVSVPLAPSEMTYTVRVYPITLDASGNVTARGDAREYSIKEYALKVLSSSNEKLTPYHGVMRAMLNYGGMAQQFFNGTGEEIAYEALASSSVYKANSNPIDAIGTSTVTFTSHDSVKKTGTAFTNTGLENDTAVMANLWLGENDIALRFYVYTDPALNLTASDLSATINRPGFDAAKEAVVSATQTKGKFLVSVSNINVSLFDKVYTLDVKTQDGASTLKAAVSVLEYLDLIIEGKASANSDASAEAQKATAKALYQFCTFVLPGEAPYYCAHKYTHWQKYDADTSHLVCSECFEVLEDRAIGNAAIRYFNAETLRIMSNNTSCALYLKNENGKSYVRLQGANKTGWWHWSILGDANAPVSGQYMVIKLRLGANNVLYNASGTEVEQKNLEFYTSTQQANLGNSTQCGRIVVSEDGQWHTIVYDMSQVEQYTVAEDGTYSAKLLQIRPFGGANTGDSTNAYMDVQFIAFSDTLEGIAKISDTYTYEVSNGRYGDSVTPNNTYTPPESINAYLDYKYLQTRPSGGTHNVTATNDLIYGESYYTRITGKGSTGQIFWTRIGTDGSGNQWPDAQINPIEVGEAKYIVMKMRGVYNATNLNFTIGTIKGEAAWPNLSSQKTAAISLPMQELSADKWTTFVIDLEKTMSAGWITDGDNSTNHKVTYLQYTMNGTFSTEMYLDFSYIAFADNFDEIAELVESDTVELVAGSEFSIEYGKDGTLKKGEINAHLGADYLYGLETAGPYNLTEVGLVDNSYYRVQSKSGVNAGQTIWERDTRNGKSFNVGTAKYLVLKMRGTVGDAKSMPLSVGTRVDGTDVSKSVNLPLNKLNATNWTTFVVPLNVVLSDGWKAGSDGTYTVSTLHFTFNDYTNQFAQQMTVDFEYMAFVDDWSEIAAVADTENVEVITASGVSVECTKNGKCTGDCTLSYENTPDGNGNTLYQTICAACETVYASHTVSDKVNFYYGAAEMNKVNKDYDNKGGSSNKTFVTENGITYLKKTKANAESTYLSYLSGSSDVASSYDVTLGQYLVIKYRSADTSGNLKLELMLNGQSSGKKGEISAASVSSAWQTTVIDISDLPGYEKGASQKLLVQFRNTAAMDIAYLAIVDDIDEARSLLTDGETYYLTDSFANRGTLYTKAGLPSKADGDVNAYLDATYISSPKGSPYLMTGEKLTDEDSTSFYRVTSQAGVAAGELAWIRPNNGASQYIPFSAGQANYLVIKVRGQVSSGTITFTMGTTKGELVHTNTATNNASIKLPTDKLSSDTWTTLVIDLKAAMSSGWVKHEKGEYVVAFMKLTFNDGTNKFPTDGEGNPAITFDIAEMSFVDNWTEVAAVSDTANVEYMTASGSSSTYGKDGSNLAAVELNKDVESMIKDKAEGELQFLYFADIHTGLDHWNRIVGYANTYSEYIDFVIHAGDYLGNTNSAASNKDLYALGSAQSIKPIYNVVGNHDTYATVVNGVTTTIRKEYVIATLFNHTENWGVMYLGGEAVNTAYYRDFPNEKVRLIVLDNYYDEGAQAVWLKGLLEEAKELGYSVLTSSHIGTAPLAEFLDTNFTAAGDTDEITSASHTKKTPFDKIIADFKTAGGKHIAHLIGHWHKDYIGKTENGVLNICVEGASSTTILENQLDGRSKDPANKDYDAFDVITVNDNETTLEIVRIGNTTDSADREKISLKINYKTGEILAENGISK